MKRLEVFLLPLDGMLVHRRSLPCNFVRFPQQIAGTHLYTWVERGTVRVKCPRPGLEPGPLAPESSALTTRPPRLPQFAVVVIIIYTLNTMYMLRSKSTIFTVFFLKVYTKTAANMTNSVLFSVHESVSWLSPVSSSLLFCSCEGPPR